MPQRITRQAEYYGLDQDAADRHARTELPDPKTFGHLLGGPRIETGMLRVDEDDE